MERQRSLRNMREQSQRLHFGDIVNKHVFTTYFVREAGLFWGCIKIIKDRPPPVEKFRDHRGDGSGEGRGSVL